MRLVNFHNGLQKTPIDILCVIININLLMCTTFKANGHNIHNLLLNYEATTVKSKNLCNKAISNNT